MSSFLYETGRTTISAALLMIGWQAANNILFGFEFLRQITTVGYWGGSLYFVVGALATLGGCSESIGVMIGALVMGIITLGAAGFWALFVYGVLVASLNGYFVNLQIVVDLHLLLISFNLRHISLYLLWLPLLVFAIVLFVLDVVVIITTIVNICCCCCDTDEPQFHRIARGSKNTREHLVALV